MRLMASVRVEVASVLSDPDQWWNSSRTLVGATLLSMVLVSRGGSFGSCSGLGRGRLPGAGGVTNQCSTGFGGTTDGFAGGFLLGGIVDQRLSVSL